MFLRVLRVILFPVSVIYDMITRLRNHLYDSGYKPSFSFDIRTICVGNLNTGGSGKTPMVEYLIRLLQEEYELATLSRGYGRNTNGFRMATEADNAQTLGDEAFQIYRKYGSRVKVAVGEERALAVPNILNEQPDVNCIVLDDAFQHRSIHPFISMVLTEFSNPFYEDFVLPTGNLREARKGASRADVVVVTKCPPAMSKTQVEEVKNKVKRYAGNKPVFFSGIAYGEPIPFGDQSALSQSIVLLSGIAHVESLKSHLSSRFQIVKHFHFRDHHSFRPGELTEILNLCKASGSSLLTTEKDMVRLIHPSLRSLTEDVPAFFLPIRTEFLFNGPEFDQFIIDRLKNY